MLVDVDILFFPILMLNGSGRMTDHHGIAISPSLRIGALKPSSDECRWIYEEIMILLCLIIWRQDSEWKITLHFLI